jgi:hypothetical protein
MLFSTIKKIFKKCDVFGSQIKLNFRQKTVHKTYFGAALTIMIAITIIIALYFYSSQIFVRDKPSIIHTEYLYKPSKQINIINRIFPLSIQLSAVGKSQLMYMEKYF